MFSIALVLGLFCLPMSAVITDGIRFIAPSQNPVLFLSDQHPCLKEQSTISEQLAILDDYMHSQPKRATVILNEEPAQSLQERWKARGVAETLSGVRSLAARHGMLYENIDLRASFIAATHIFESYLTQRPYDKTLAFGPCPKQLKKVADVTLDDLLQEKEHHIEEIKHVGAWSDRMQEFSDSLHKRLLSTISGRDLSLQVSQLCTLVDKDVIRRVETAATDLGCFLFDTYAQGKVVSYSTDHTILLVAGSGHTHNIKTRLKYYQGWQDYDLYDQGSMMSAYQLKRMLGLITWKDRLAQFCNCGWVG